MNLNIRAPSGGGKKNKKTQTTKPLEIDIRASSESTICSKTSCVMSTSSKTGVCCSVSPHAFLQTPLNCFTTSLFLSFSLTEWKASHTPSCAMMHPYWLARWYKHIVRQLTHWTKSTVLKNRLMSFLIDVFLFPLFHCIFFRTYKINRSLLFLFQMQLKLSNGFQSYRHNCISLISLGSQAKKMCPVCVFLALPVTYSPPILFE